MPPPLLHLDQSPRPIGRERRRQRGSSVERPLTSGTLAYCLHVELGSRGYGTRRESATKVSSYDPSEPTDQTLMSSHFRCRAAPSRRCSWSVQLIGRTVVVDGVHRAMKVAAPGLPHGTGSGTEDEEAHLPRCDGVGCQQVSNCPNWAGTRGATTVLLRFYTPSPRSSGCRGDWRPCDRRASDTITLASDSPVV